MRRRSTLASALALAGALALTGCSASSGSTSGDSVVPGSEPPTQAAPGGTAPAEGGLPAVEDAYDLTKAPAPAAGTGEKPTTLLTRDLVAGNGAEATATSTVEVQYVGTNWDDGEAFDSSWDRGQPATFPLNGVVPGFAQGIEGMKVGGRREIVIPPALGYGAEGSPPAVGPNQTLVFVVDLLGVQ